MDFSYRFRSDPANPEWLQSRFGGWQEFRTRSIQKIDEGSSFVVLADITAYYENVDLNLLISDLRQINAPNDILALLRSCLERWAQVPGRGIPQGQSPSDILGKLYLNNVDQNLRAMGYTHFRYVDDIRIFCRTQVEAKKALVDLTKLLRKRGLNLQSAKSEIHRADTARQIIEGVLPILMSVRHNFIREVVALLGPGNPYLSLTDAEEMLAGSAENTPIALIREAYQAYFIDSGDANFDKTLFRFLLKRLGAQSDGFAVDHSSTLFEKHPEEGQAVLGYFKAVGAAASVETSITAFLNSPEAVYPYQKYQIIEWFNSLEHSPSAELLDTARRLAFDGSQPPYLRSVCRQLVGNHGTPADLERMEAEYADARNAIEQCEITCSLRRMETSRRNAFLRRTEGDGFLNRNAVRLVRSAGA